ncbi:MAG: tetratricopeptide repeat protein [Betaproteobacteria bacterium]
MNIFQFKKLVYSACGASVLLVAASAASQPRAYLARDLALLPEWCKYTQDFRDKVPGGNNPTEIRRWMERTQGVFHAMHHYCWGLILQNEATFFVKDRALRLNKLDNSVREFDYVIHRSHPTFALLPELYTKKAESLSALGRSALAIAEFESAIAFKADYWPAYLGLSEHYLSVNNPAKARETLERGITASPEAIPLKERLEKLGAQPKGASK